MVARTSADNPVEQYETRSVRGTLALGRRLARRLECGDCVALAGPLGAGKTVLVRGLATGLGLADPRMVASPTFVLVREYPARWPVYHIDLYRMAEAEGELEGLGLEEMLRDGVVLVEWGDRAPAALPGDCWRIEIAIAGPTARRFTVVPGGLPANRKGRRGSGD